MKTRFIKSILTLLLSLTVLSIAANDYLKIYFKDGHTERHFMKLVENITVTKYDLEGHLQSDYQMQQIVMADTTYSYYLSDIESMTFTKVEKEELKNNVESVVNSVTPLFEQFSTVEEMEARIDEIKNINGVEDVWRVGTDIVVQVRDWHKISFTFPIVFENTSDYYDNLAMTLKRIKHQAPVKEDGSPVKVVIAFQMIDDPRLDNHEEKLRKLHDEFDDLGFDVTFLPNESGELLDLDFFERRMFDYDIVLLQTHGSYDGWKHGFFTGIKTDDTHGILDFALNPSDPLDLFDFDDIGYSSCKTSEHGYGWFRIVKEDYIKKSNYSFTGPGPHFVYMASCSSLEGKEELSHEHNGETETFPNTSDAVAKIFFDKGADIYIGYDKSTAGMGYTAYKFFHNMLKGLSQETAFYYLDDIDDKHETRTEEQASLIDLVNPKSKNNPRKYFFFKPHTQEKDDEIANAEYKQSKTVKLSGEATLHDFDNEAIKLGFMVTYYDPVEHSRYIKAETAPVCYTNKVEFYADIDNLEPGKTYHYRAYTHDGLNYNWGEERSFMLSSQGGDSHTSCPDNNHPHMLDLGLPSGTKWACCNVGASKPEEYGNYYAWGETQPKDYYYWDSYIHCDGSSTTCHDIGSDIAGTQYDAATTNWGAPWQMPSKEQFLEFQNTCTSILTTENGVYGLRVTGPNGSTLFFPAAGCRLYDSLYDNMYSAGSEGYYWSSTLNEPRPQYAWFFFIPYVVVQMSDDTGRFGGLSVRPVCK